MVRVAGLPAESVRSLRGPESVRWADDVISREDDLRDRGAHISDLLHETVKSTVDDQRRRALVNLRRQVFTNKLPRDVEAAATLARGLDGEVSVKLLAWLWDRQQLNLALAKGSEVVERELVAARTALRELADEPRLRQGLLLASASLDQYLDSYLRADPARPNKRHRKIERSIMEYLYRAACKTSPFSAFTGLALGEFQDGDEQPRVDEQWSDHPRLNIAVLGRIAELVMENHERRADLPVTLVTGWQAELDRIRYVRRKVTTGDDSRTVSFDVVRESLFFLNQSSGLDRMLALFDSGHSIRYGDLVDRLAGEADADRADYDRYLGVLLRLGLLHVPSLAVNVHSPDPLASFQDSVRGIGVVWADELADRLGEVAEIVAAYPGASLSTRRQLLANLRTELAAVLDSLGASGATLPQTVLYEDTRAADDVLPVSRTRWSAVTDSLGELAGLMPVFDMTLPPRLLFKSYFLARFGRGGRCDDVLKLVYGFQEEIYEHYQRISSRRRPFDDNGDYVPLDNWLHSPQIDAIDLARKEFVARMRELAAAGDTKEIRLDQSFVDAVAAAVAPARADFLPQCHFLQPFERDGQARAVLNQSWGGISFPFSRFTHCFTDRDLAGRTRDSARERQPGDAVFVEVTGGFATTNLNLHEPMTDYELVCPGDISSADPEHQLPLADLSVEHDIESDRLVLRSQRLGREVIPLYLGYLMPMALPDVPRTLLMLAPTSNVKVDCWGGVPPRTVDGVEVRPRVTVGDLVINRRQWAVSAELLPNREPVADEAEWFLGWRRWQAAHNIPAQVFVAVQPNADAPVKQKPHYLDFDSVLSLKVFDTLIRNTDDRVELQEMLPGEREAFTRSDRGHHVTEIVIETTHSAVGKGNR